MALGILLGDYINLSPKIAMIGCLTLLLLLGWEHFFVQKKRLHFGILVALLTAMIGMLSVSLATIQNNPHHYSHFGIAQSRTYTLKIQEVLKENAFSQRYIAQLQYMDGKKLKGKVLVQINKNPATAALRVDDELITHTTLQAVPRPLNPYQFDYGSYLEGLGVHHQIRLSKERYILKEHPTETLWGLAARTRNHITSQLRKEAFGTAELGIIQALLLGERNEVTEATNTDYKDAGAFHILALSGLHIGILLGLLHFLLAPLEFLPNGRVVKMVSIVLLLWAFAFLAGMSPSILRAVTMFSFVAYALYLNRPTNHFNILALSFFFILLLINPLLLFQVGFQLSYAAVFAIIWIYPLLQKLWIPKNWVLKRGWELLAVSVAAQLGVLPLGLYYFHQFPGLFFLSSLLILPFLALILGIGIVVITLALTNSLPHVLVVLYNNIIGWMNTTIAWVAQQERFIFRNISFDAIQLLLGYTILITLVWMLEKVTFKRTALFLCSIICFQLWVIGKTQHIYQKELLVLGHTGNNTTLLHQTGQKAMVYTNNWSKANRMVTDYSIAQHLRQIEHRPIKNSFKIGKESLIVIDSTFSKLPSHYLKATTLLLTQSPKINLERLLDSVQPKLILADGSNYHSYIARWKATCQKRKLPFHYTGEKGAYIFNKP
ncbi:ComEC/Rec2 family competence protein [Arenibacter lacus]|uniref:ComEC/Rec2 family competence protein n=1 Tax=Arenibacter lacus TaxID=2608629 RepID=UPI001CC50516|nr:ComEC/Rec2 family competence protein [Arenibacter lacus]